jgi:hypothetical protein
MQRHLPKYLWIKQDSVTDISLTFHTQLLFCCFPLTFFYLNTGLWVVEWWCMGALPCNSVCYCEGNRTPRGFASSATFSECSARGTQSAPFIFRIESEPQWGWCQVWQWYFCGVDTGILESSTLIMLQLLCLTGSLWRCQSQQSFNTLTPFNFLFYSLHVSAPTGHPQVRYTISYHFCVNTTDPLHICNLIIGMLYVVIGFSTYSPVTWHHIKYKNKKCKINKIPRY